MDDKFWYNISMVSLVVSTYFTQLSSCQRSRQVFKFFYALIFRPSYFAVQMSCAYFLVSFYRFIIKSINLMFNKSFLDFFLLNILEELNRDDELLATRAILFERKVYHFLPVVFFRFEAENLHFFKIFARDFKRLCFRLEFSCSKRWIFYRM